MPIYPEARLRLVPRRFPVAVERNRITHHTAVTNARSLYDDFADGGPCSHFYVAEDGTVEQYIDTRFHSAADLEGNDATISIETWDGYPGGAAGYWRHSSDVPPWNARQLAAIVRLDAWIIRTHPSIPARLATSSKIGAPSKGLAWHRLGVDGYFPALPSIFAGRLQRGGGMYWSTKRGKACPGDRRIAQMPAILAGVQLALTPKPAPAQSVPDVQEDDMLIIRRASNGASFIVLGGKGSKIVSAADLDVYGQAGIISVELSDAGYAQAERVYLTAA